MIIVNGGPTDNSLKIIEKLSDKGARIVVINKEKILKYLANSYENETNNTNSFFIYNIKRMKNANSLMILEK